MIEKQTESKHILERKQMAKKKECLNRDKKEKQRENSEYVRQMTEIEPM